MKFDVKIDCMALFNECMDQTLIDYRNRTTETGQSIAATHTLDRSLLDTFYVNLHSVSEALRTALRKQVCEVLFIPTCCNIGCTSTPAYHRRVSQLR